MQKQHFFFAFTLYIMIAPAFMVNFADLKTFSHHYDINDENNDGPLVASKKHHRIAVDFRK